MGRSHAPDRFREAVSVPAGRGLLVAIALTSAVMVTEFAGGLVANSLALLSDAGHMLTDVLALAMAWFAVTVARRPVSSRKTWGWHRIEILAALINGVLLILICLAIVVEAWRRLRAPEPVAGGLVLAVAAIGLAADLVGMWFLSRAGRSVNVRAARMHLAGDALSSAGVLVSGAVIAATSWYRIDALVSFGIGCVILAGAWGIIRETVDILMEGAPHGIDPDEVGRAIGGLAGVRGVHDLHVWCITSGMAALSGHVILDGEALARSDEVLNRIKEMLRVRFGIDHTTIQFESETYTEVGEVH